MIQSIIKRDGRVVLYDQNKIASAILKALEASHEGNAADAARVANDVQRDLESKFPSDSPNIEAVQDTVERQLMNHGFNSAAKAYILYRANRTRAREANTVLMKTIDEITNIDARVSDMKRDNANIDGNTAMGSMLQIGAAGAKAYNEMYLLRPEHAKAYREGDIHIHDFDFYSLTTTCCQIDILKLFHGGFSTGHGYLREPMSIQSYAALAAIAIQSNQNDQHGGQSIPNFDYAMAEGIAKTYRKAFTRRLKDTVEDYLDLCDEEANIKAVIAAAEAATGETAKLESSPAFVDAVAKELCSRYDLDDAKAHRLIAKASKRAFQKTDGDTKQSMEGFVHNLNTMHSRAGAQTPFSSINYGTDTSPEGRMVMKNVLLATEDGLGGGETPIFPIQIFRVKEGINFNPGDPNYDLYRLAIKTSAKRLFPNFSFLDAPYNLKYYQPGRPETEIAYMGCRTRVMGNTYDKTREMAPRRGNLSFTSINLPRIAIKSGGDLTWFFEELERKMQLVVDQLDERFAIISKKKVKNFPFLMGEGVWIDSEKLNWNDEVGEVLKHGSLTIGFIGLAECLKALRGAHHGESEESQNLGLEIISAMRSFTDRISRERGLNYALIATPAEGLSGRFIRMDRERFGSIPGVTEKEYYTNSFHVPVYHQCSAFHKLSVEAPYHELTNGGHISYVEMDGDPMQNLDAFEKIVRFMHDVGIGYGSINHPVDRDPVCGFNGIIGDSCPHCGRTEADGNRRFERIRRITGYLVGTLDRFNNAKRAEERDRVKHGTK